MANDKRADADLKKRLTPEQYNVTQCSATEPPFRNEFWDHHEPGIYVDVVSGEPLFASTDKFDSGTGWPSFWKPIAEENVVQNVPQQGGFKVSCALCDAHLGHVFDDGPAPTGLRYCMDGVALRFIPRPAA